MALYFNLVHDDKEDGGGPGAVDVSSRIIASGHEDLRDGDRIKITSESAE